MSEATTLKADYLVVGSGAMGMAFTDVIVSESGASVVIVDRHDQPGGHWNDAYPFVRLHSASSYYGVNSRALGENAIERTGLSRGFGESASAAEICSYFDRVMQQQFLPSGRVRYFPQCDYLGEGRFVRRWSGREYRVAAHRIVDATFTATATPSTHAPEYCIAPGVRCIAPNALSRAARAEQYVVIGAGKTGMDACSWLLGHGVPAERITWIMPCDSWLLDRANVEAGDAFVAQRMESLLRQIELIREAVCVEHLLRLLAENGELLRIDERVTPTRYRCATVTRAELAQLRTITSVVRMGYVQRVEPGRIVMDQGSIATSAHALHIDCTASGIQARPPVRVFEPDAITLQPIRTFQPCFSAALIAHIDLAYDSDARRNVLCTPIPLPIRDVDWLEMFVANVRNQFLWATEPGVRQWIARSRLDLNHRQSPEPPPEAAALVRRFQAGAGAAAAKGEELLRKGRQISAPSQATATSVCA